MSVWVTETFKGQAFWDWARLGSLTENEWVKCVNLTDVVFTGGTLAATGDFEEVRYPTGLASDILKGPRIDAAEFRRIFFNSIREDGVRGNQGHVTRKILESATRFTTGLKGVYLAYLAFCDEPTSFGASAAAVDADFVNKFVEHAFRAQSGIMKSTPAVAEAAFDRVDKRALGEATRWQVVAGKARSLLTLRWCSQAMRDGKGKFEHDRRGFAYLTNFAESHALDFPDDWIVHFDGWLTYVQLPNQDDGEWIVLTSADLDRLQQMCISRSMFELHHATWGTTSGNDMAPYRLAKRNMLKVFQDAIAASIGEGKDPSLLCRNFRKLFNTYLSMAAGELSDEGTQQMLDDIRVNKFGDMIGASRYFAILRACPFDIAQDIGRIYKLLPAGDYDIGESFCARQKQHMSTNEANPIEGDNPCDLNEFRQYLRKLMIQTLTIANGGKGVGVCYVNPTPRWWRKYVSQGIVPDGLDWVDQVDLRGVQPYVERTEENVAQWKDSAACEEDLEEAMDPGKPGMKKRNMLMRYLFDPTCPTASSARSCLSRKEHVHRVGFKMEAHKPVARLFFIGNLSDRLVQSEMEENVHRVALNTPGYMIGQSPEFTTRKIMSMVAPGLTTDRKAHFFNFDISAWSPGMRADIQRLSHDIWAEVFDRPEFRRAHMINEGATVILNKRGYEGKYINPEGNFEGYNGKEMTFLHCALMGYSVYRYRRKTGHRLTVRLAAFIDDGLAQFEDAAENGAARFLEFAEVVEETYKSLGFLLERTKCYMSDKFAIFLNEIYLNGRHITYGLRAIMRVGTKVFDEHETLSARANSYFSGTQGAMKAGLDVVAGQVAYLWLIGRLIMKYGARKFMDERACVLYCFTPRGLGGLGCSGFVGLSSNLVTDGLTEGIALLQELGRAFPAYRTKIIALLRQAIAIKSSTATLLSPSSLPDARAPMSETRLAAAVSVALKKARLTSKAARIVNLSKSLHIEDFASAVVEPSIMVNPTLMDDIVASTPLSLLLGLVKKFNSARTMTQLVGRATMKRIERANHEDAIRSFGAFRFR